MNAIVTGACGFIGSAMMEQMAQKGYKVEGWDITSGVMRQKVNVRRVDMTNMSMIEDALHSFAPDIIIHCAGSANVSDSVSNPDRDFALNVGITHNLLCGMHRQGLSKTVLVFLSSAAVYGNPGRLPILEEDKIHPISPYALHKSMCEDMCRYFVENHGFDIRIARIFSAYGVGLKKQLFWDMYRKYVATGRLEMFGDGSESRDFIHIDDLKNALYLIATAPRTDIVINVANGEEITIRRTAEIFATWMRIHKADIVFTGEKRIGDPNNWCADISKIKQLGYVKSISIEQGISSYCDWCIESNDN